MKKVEVVIHKEEGNEVRVISPRGGEWFFKLAKDEMSNLHISVTDAADNIILLDI